VKAEWLAAVALVGDHWTIPDEMSEMLPPEAMVEGGVALVSQILALLTSFIGERLTQQIVREAWPQVSFKNLDSTNRS
jgi:hypothetical protein